MIIQIVQIDGQTATCVRFSCFGETLAPVLGISIPYGSTEELSVLLRQHLPRVTGDIRSILSLPVDLLYLRELQLPFSDRPKIRAVLPLELSRDSAETCSEPVCDVVVLDSGRQLAGWADPAKVSALLTLLSPAIGDPEVVTCHPLSWHHLPLLDQETAVILDRHAIAVVRQQGMLTCRLMRTDDPADIDRTLAAWQLADVAVPALRYRLDDIILPDERPLPLPEQLSTLPAGCAIAPAEFLSPLAMAQSYRYGDIFNLRNGSLAWQGTHSHRLRRYRTSVLLALFLALLIAGDAGWRWYRLKQDIAATNSAIASIYKEVFPNRTKAVDESAEIKAEIRRLRTEAGGIELLRFLKMLAQMKDDQITAFTDIEFDGEHFYLKGYALSAQTVNLLVQQMKAAGLHPEQPELTTRPDSTTLFTIKGLSRREERK